MHVTSGESPTRESGYVATQTSDLSQRNQCVYAVDCEMCYTTVGLQLTRVSVIDMKLEVVYESLVKPSHPIVDYNTRCVSNECVRCVCEGVLVEWVRCEGVLVEWVWCEGVLVEWVWCESVLVEWVKCEGVLVEWVWCEGVLVEWVRCEGVLVEWVRFVRVC